jgi:signal transduction histidine kinase/CheY-like chemotaxis protein
VAKVLEAALAGNGTENYELPLYSQAGERIEILLDATTRRDSEGSIIGVIGVGQDITGLREQEERLRQAQKMESVGLLTGGIAHDFNNLLSVIKGNLDLALDRLGDQDEANLLRDILSDAATASTDAAKLTNRLQSFASQQSFRHESVNLRSLVSSALLKALPAASSDIDFSINIDQVDVMVMVDNMQLENAIVSVIDNAKDSIEAAGKISVEAQIERFTGEAAAEYSLQAGEYIVITVGDDGCGIPESSLQRVIEPFFSTKTIGQSAGFGLSVVHGFVNKSGGRLDLKSTVDVGTTVVIVLPFIPGTVDRPVSQIQTEEDKFPRQTGTVLVVEDEERLRKLAARHLGSTGFQVIEAGNAEEALKVLATNGDEIDILVSDIRMPGEMSGRELAGQVSKLYPTVRLLLTTGYEEEAPDPSDKARLPEWQIPVLRKPYSRAELIAAVTDLV